MSVLKYKDHGEVKKVFAPTIDAYTKAETDTLLTKKMTNELGQAGANLLEWASAQAVGGAFYINPTVTTAGVPSDTWYAGLLEVNGGGRRMTISTTGVAPITYVNVTSSGIWQGWSKIATMDDINSAIQTAIGNAIGGSY